MAKKGTTLTEFRAFLLLISLRVTLVTRMDVALLFTSDQQRQKGAPVKRNERIEILPLTIERFVRCQEHKNEHDTDAIAPDVSDRGHDQ